jgi:hypothetical protein
MLKANSAKNRFAAARRVLSAFLDVRRPLCLAKRAKRSRNIDSRKKSALNGKTTAAEDDLAHLQTPLAALFRRSARGASMPHCDSNRKISSQ